MKNSFALALWITASGAMAQTATPDTCDLRYISMTETKVEGATTITMEVYTSCYLETYPYLALRRNSDNAILIEGELNSFGQPENTIDQYSLAIPDSIPFDPSTHTIIMVSSIGRVHQEIVADISTVREGTITNLYDAFGKDTTLTKDFGFSCITRYGGQTILFDAGSNADIFKHNAETLGFDLTEVDMVVVSHGHFDHLNGLDYLLEVNPDVKIYFPYDIFWGAPVPINATGRAPETSDSLPAHMRYFDGTDRFTINQTGRFWNANVQYVTEAIELAPGLTIIPTTSELTGYFSCYPTADMVEGIDPKESQNCNNMGLPELSLSMRTDNGQVVVVGCSHTGVANIVREVKQHTADDIALVYGGYHMIPYERPQVNETVQALRDELGVQRVAPAHCTGHLAFKLLLDAYGEAYEYAGLGEVTRY